MALAEVKETVYNILLVGETGVGKSTFINSFANYVHYSSFEDAIEAKDVKVLIPAKFTFAGHNITFGEDEDECLAVGQSGTQRCKIYTFKSGFGVVIRFIDTPGVADVRGIDQDKENLAHMVDYLGKFEYINAIVIILPPDETKLKASFRYCITQLLASLEKSALNNIIFLFTHSKITFYEPGGTKELLNEIAEDIKSKRPNVNINIKESNLFCVDNESFKILVANKLKYVIGEKIKNGSKDSWNESVASIEKLLQHIGSLEPHNIKNSVSLVKARSLVSTLAKPLSDISQLIHDNIRGLDSYKKQLSMNDVDSKQLKNGLYRKRIDFHVRQLGCTMNVCTHQDCTELNKKLNTSVVSYKSECHNPCKVRNAKGKNNLRYCSAMDMKGTTEAVCKKCKHSYLNHIHINYKWEMFEREDVNEKIKKRLDKNEINKMTIEEAIKKCFEEKRKYQEEENYIVNSVAKFAVYLNKSAIVLYNDAYEEYLKLISDESDRGDDIQAAKIKHYKDLLENYQKHKELLEKNCNKSGIENNDQYFTLNEADILNIIENLFKLEICGSRIKKMYDATARSHVLNDTEKKYTVANNDQAKKFFKAIHQSV